MVLIIAEVTIGFSPVTYTVNEADNQVRLFVEVLSGTLEGTVTVLFRTIPASASESGTLGQYRHSNSV